MSRLFRGGRGPLALALIGVTMAACGTAPSAPRFDQDDGMLPVPTTSSSPRAREVELDVRDLKLVSRWPQTPRYRLEAVLVSFNPTDRMVEGLCVVRFVEQHRRWNFDLFCGIANTCDNTPDYIEQLLAEVGVPLRPLLPGQTRHQPVMVDDDGLTKANVGHATFQPKF